MRRILVVLTLVLLAAAPRIPSPETDPAVLALDPAAAAKPRREVRDVFAFIAVPEPGRPAWWDEVSGRLSREPEPGDLAGQLDFVMRAYAEKGRPREAIKLYTEIAGQAAKAGNDRLRLRVFYEIAYLYEVHLRDVERALAAYADCARFPLADAAEARQNRIAAGFGALRVLQAGGGSARRPPERRPPERRPPERRPPASPAEVVALYELFAYDLVTCADAYAGLVQPEVFLRLGDLLLCSTGGKAAARRAYEAAVATAERISEKLPPNYRAPGSAARVALRILDIDAIDFARVPDGAFEGRALGYNAPVAVRAAFRGGRMVELHVTELGDKRPLDAYRVLPQRLLDAQRLEVDGISGATVTSRAILSATAGALLSSDVFGTSPNGGGNAR